MKRIVYTLGLTFCALFFAAGTASAQMTYQNGTFNFSQTAKFSTLHANRVYVSTDAKSGGLTIINAIGKILQLVPRESNVNWGGLATFGITIDDLILTPAFSTQSVQSAIPNAVLISSDGKKLTDYNVILVYMVKAMQEQQAEIETLKAEVATLKNR